MEHAILCCGGLPGGKSVNLLLGWPHTTRTALYTGGVEILMFAELEPLSDGERTKHTDISLALCIVLLAVNLVIIHIVFSVCERDMAGRTLEALRVI